MFLVLKKCLAKGGKPNDGKWNAHRTVSRQLHRNVVILTIIEKEVAGMEYLIIIVIVFEIAIIYFLDQIKTVLIRIEKNKE